MSQDELAATEARRISREAGPDERLRLSALWESAPDAPAKDPVTKYVNLEIEPSPAAKGDGILRIFEGQAFEETILLTPAVYRLVAGGQDPTATGKDLSGRFVLKAGGNGLGRVSVEREALASIMQAVCPIEMERAFRLVATEPRGPAKSTALPNLVTLFTQRWELDMIHAAVDDAVAKVPSRMLHLIAGKDLVSLAVRKEELIVGENGVFRSPLAAAIVRPPELPRCSTLIVAGDADMYRDRDAPFLQNTFGTGPVRSLVLDMAKLRDAMAALTPEARQAALDLLDLLVQRAAELNREHARRPPVPVHPLAPARRLQKILAPAPAPTPEVETAPIDTNIETEAPDDFAPAMDLAANFEQIEPVESEIEPEASERDNEASMIEHEAEEVELDGAGEKTESAAIDADIETGVSDIEELAPAPEVAAKTEESEIEAEPSESGSDTDAPMLAFEAEAEEFALEALGEKSEIEVVEEELEVAEG